MRSSTPRPRARQLSRNVSTRRLASLLEHHRPNQSVVSENVPHAHSPTFVPVLCQFCRQTLSRVQDSRHIELGSALRELGNTRQVGSPLPSRSSISICRLARNSSGVSACLLRFGALAFRLVHAGAVTIFLGRWPDDQRPTGARETPASTPVQAAVQSPAPPGMRSGLPCIRTGCRPETQSC